MLRELIKAIKGVAASGARPVFGRAPTVTLQGHSTGQHNGHTSHYMYSRRKDVGAARGGKEGNNAFAGDLPYQAVNLSSDNSAQRNLMRNALTAANPVAPEVFDLLFAEFAWAKGQVDSYVVSAARLGHRELCAHLIASANKQGGFGWNFLHEEVLGMSIVIIVHACVCVCLRVNARF